MSVPVTPNGVVNAEAYAAAITHYILAQTLGVQVFYSHRGQAAIPLYVIADNGNQEMREILGTKARVSSRTFEISTFNTGFPPSDDTLMDDIITDEFGIVNVVIESDSDTLGAIYKLTAVNTKAKRIQAA